MSLEALARVVQTDPVSLPTAAARPTRTSPKAALLHHPVGHYLQEAWIGGVSTRRVDELVQAMGLSGISKSTVSKLCKDIDERVGEFLNRPLSGAWPYVWLDATYLKVRQGGRIVSVAAIIAVAVNTDGRREIIGLGTGPSEAETFWTEFLRGLKARGLAGVKLATSAPTPASRQPSGASSRRAGKGAAWGR